MQKVSKAIILTLIFLVILPRISIDLYLPSLPAIGVDLHASDKLLQMTLTIFMLGYALSMLIAGPLSDYFGNKRVFIYGISIFLVATFVCATTTSIHVLIWARFFQALGGCCGTLIARVLVKQLYEPKEQIKILSHLSAAMAICPLFIPILGGTLQVYFGWHIAFYLLAGLALALLFLCQKTIETSPTTTASFSFIELLNNYKLLLTHRLFVGYSLAIGLVWCSYFAFTLESPFIFQNQLGFNSLHFGFIYALAIAGYVIGTRITKAYANEIGWDRLILIAAIFSLLGAIVLMLLVELFPLHALSVILPIMLIMVTVGIIIPCTQGAVMQPFPHIVGTASGLFFFIQMAFGSACGFVLHLCNESSATPLAVSILVSSVLLFISFYWLVVLAKCRVD